MRILMLAHRIPYPPHTGDKTRAYHVARYLACRHEVTLAFLVDDGADVPGVPVLQKDLGSIEYSRLWRPWSVCKGLVGLATGATLTAAYFRSGRLRRRLMKRAAGIPYDVVYASSSPMAQYAAPLELPLVMDFVDVDSDKWSQYARHSARPQRWIYEAEGRQLRTYEAEIAQRAKLCVLATSTEEALLKSFAPWAQTAVVGNGIDLDYFRPVDGRSQCPAVIFTGAMDYLPNVDAVRYFCSDILPSIRSEVPDTRFLIVGLNPASEVRKLTDIPGVVVTGTVPDVRPYYHRASVCVAPLRIGRGVQNKVLQAMAMGMPVVASSTAQRGLEAEPGRHLHVEDDPSAFARTVVQLLRSPEARRELGRKARAFVEANHGWGASGDRLDALLRAVAAEGRGSRTVTP